MVQIVLTAISPIYINIDATTNGVSSPVAGLRHVSPPQTKTTPSESTLTPGKNICADCERLIV